MNNLKKIIGIFSVLSCICMSVSLASTGTVNTPAARIREKASTDSDVLTKVYEDEEVEILGEEGDWYQVKANGKTGYVSKTLIKTSTSTNTTTNTEDTNTTSENTVANNVSTYTTEEPKTTENKNVINKDTSLRLLPNFASNELRILIKDTDVKIEKELNNWAKVSLADNSTGWVLKNTITYKKEEVVEETNNDENKVEENTVVENTTSENTTDTNTTATNTNTVSDNTISNSKGKVNVETANVRDKASKSSEIIERLDEGDEVTIVEEDGDWYKITSSKVSSGYVSKSLITIVKDEVSSRSQVESREETANVETTANSSKGSDVVEFAKQFLGTSYVVGGKTPETGFDCSGFTRYVFKNFGYSLGSVAADQDSVGREVARSELQPGDLILFQNEGKTKIGHTGIYIGNNEFIHAANPERGVVIDNLVTMQYYNERFVTARRIVE